MSETALMEAKKWDWMNPAMDPVDVPYNCKTVYKYQQPVIHDRLEEFSKIIHDRMENFPEDPLLVFDGWGVITIQSDYVMTPKEKSERQENLRKAGATIIGNMRLTSQTFFRDKSTISIDELGNMFRKE